MVSTPTQSKEDMEMEIQLLEDQIKELFTFKILLLGAGESGAFSRLQAQACTRSSTHTRATQTYPSHAHTHTCSLAPSVCAPQPDPVQSLHDNTFNAHTHVCEMKWQANRPS
jgi:hypothetical protein